LFLSISLAVTPHSSIYTITLECILKIRPCMAKPSSSRVHQGAD
jgi:hypothetical protein